MEFGFTSQLTYSLKHGYHKMKVTDVDLAWIGIELIITIRGHPFMTSSPRGGKASGKADKVREVA